MSQSDRGLPCPACMMQIGLESWQERHADDSLAATQLSDRAFDPPTTSALSRQLPNLQVLQLLGQGGMGAVYRARQESLDRIVAVKLIRPDADGLPNFSARFMREARALARLNHPHIVTVHDFGTVVLEGPVDGENIAGGRSARATGPPSTLYYLVMEFVEGQNLRQLIDSQHLSPAEALAIVPPICEALQYAHNAGIVHRDVKPENILIDVEGRVKIADFGLAKLAEGEETGTLTGTHQVMGTPRYMAPEQMEGSHGVDHRADIYSLGVVFYEMLTGQVPLGHFDPPSKKVQVDVRLDDVVLRSLAREPERRYQQASDIKVDVETISRHGLAASNEPAPIEPSRPDRDADAVDMVAPGSGAGPANESPPIDPEVLHAWQQIEPARQWLQAISYINWVGIPVMIALIATAIWLWAPDSIRRAEDTWGVLLAVTLLFPLNAVIHVAAKGLRQLRWYWLSVAGSILAMLVPPGQILGLPLGLWLLSMLATERIRAAFGQVVSARPPIVLPSDPAPRSGVDAKNRFDWGIFATLLSVSLLTHALIAFSMAWTQSPWALIGLTLLWFTFGAVSAYQEDSAGEIPASVNLMVGLFLSLALVSFGVVLSETLWPLLTVVICLAAMIAGGAAGLGIREEDESAEKEAGDETADAQAETLDAEEDEEDPATRVRHAAMWIAFIGLLACWEIIKGDSGLLQAATGGETDTIRPGDWFFLLGPVLLLGMIPMFLLRWYPVAIATAVLCLLVALANSHALYQIGALIVGFSALWTLVRPDVQAVFREQRIASTPSPEFGTRETIGRMLLLMSLLIGGSWFLAIAMDDVHETAQLESQESAGEFAGPPSDVSQAESLRTAATQGDLGTLKATLAAGVDVNSADEQGQTALMHAASSGNVRSMVVLLMRGANEQERDKQSRTPLMHAAKLGQTAAVQMLLDLRRVDSDEELQFRVSRLDTDVDLSSPWKKMRFDPLPGAVDRSGETALIKAVTAGHSDTVLALLHETDRLHDGQGLTPLARAVNAGQTELLLQVLDRDSRVRIINSVAQPSLLFFPDGVRGESDASGLPVPDYLEANGMKEVADSLRNQIDEMIRDCGEKLATAKTDVEKSLLLRQRSACQWQLGNAKAAESDLAEANRLEKDVPRVPDEPKSQSE